MDDARIWSLETGEGPLVATAVHHGHALRREVAELIALSPEERLREEDPFTAEWTALAPTRVVGHRSRFEIDLNRPRDEAFYRGPADAWGLDVWKSPPPEDLIARSLAEHDAFYAALRDVLARTEEREGGFVLFDLHSYNHRRDGPQGPPADPTKNPQVNIGTGSMDRERWAPLVDRFIADLRAFDFPGGALDVRENVKFLGRRVAQSVHEAFPRTGCALAIEVKKFFMDEWTAEVDRERFEAVGAALASTVPGVLQELSRL
jgi:N-formylglutamate amidohydrolase